jgi:hypothetical protein
MNLNLNQSNIALAIYGTHTEAESAIKELQQSSFDMNKLSVVGRSHHVDERVLGYYNTGDRMKTWEKVGAFWGEIWGLHSGPAFFCIPGFGHLVFAGPIVSWLTGVLKSAVRAFVRKSPNIKSYEFGENINLPGGDGVTVIYT